MIKKIIKSILVLGLIALVVMQFIRPDKNSGGYESIAVFEVETNPTEEVTQLLKTHCYDCHSNQTRYPWYGEIAPFSYWLAEHIEHGKEELNFSDWASYSAKRKDHKLDEVIEEVEEGHMPLDSYTWIHGTLTEEEKTTLIQWAGLARLRYQEEMQSTGN